MRDSRKMSGEKDFGDGIVIQYDNNSYGYIYIIFSVFTACVIIFYIFIISKNGTIHFVECIKLLSRDLIRMLSINIYM